MSTNPFAVLTPHQLAQFRAHAEHAYRYNDKDGLEAVVTEAGDILDGAADDALCMPIGQCVAPYCKRDSGTLYLCGKCALESEHSASVAAGAYDVEVLF